jgi:superfamily II DNA helicase RecQ
MKIKIFTIPAWDSAPGTDEMNAFTGNHKVLEIMPKFSEGAGKPFWTFAVSYLESAPGETRYKKKRNREKKDYKSILDEVAFQRFTVLRKIRKTLSNTFAVPAFAILTDHQMAELARLPELTLQSFDDIPGFGEGKINRFAQAIIDGLAGEKPAEKETE